MPNPHYAFRDSSGRETHERRKLPIGQWHETSRTIMEGRVGLLTFTNLIDALGFARSPILAILEVADTHDTDHYSLSVRQKPIRQSNIKDALRRFSRSVASEFIEQWQCPASVSKYLRTGQKALLVDAADAMDNQFFDDRPPAEEIPHLIAFSAICGEPHSGARSVAMNSGYSLAVLHERLLHEIEDNAHD